MRNQLLLYAIQKLTKNPLKKVLSFIHILEFIKRHISMSAVFNKHVDDVDLQTDQERNLFIYGPAHEHSYPRSFELDLEEIENLDNESTERGRKAT